MTFYRSLMVYAFYYFRSGNCIVNGLSVTSIIAYDVSENMFNMDASGSLYILAILGEHKMYIFVGARKTNHFYLNYFYSFNLLNVYSCRDQETYNNFYLNYIYCFYIFSVYTCRGLGPLYYYLYYLLFDKCIYQQRPGNL